MEIIDQVISQCFAYKTKNRKRKTAKSYLWDILGLLHLAHVSAAVLVAGGAVGGSVVDAVAVLVVFAVGVDSCAVLTLLNVLFRQPLTLHVSLDPEVGEEHEEEGSIHPDEVEDHGELVVTAVHEVILGGVEGYQNKLDLLGRIRNQSSTIMNICRICLGAFCKETLTWHSNKTC